MDAGHVSEYALSASLLFLPSFCSSYGWIYCVESGKTIACVALSLPSRVYYLARPIKTAMLRRLVKQ